MRSDRLCATVLGMKIIEGEFRVVGEDPDPKRQTRLTGVLKDFRYLATHRTVWFLTGWVSLCFWIAHQP